MEISVKEYAEKYNPVLNRRGFKMSESYLYRLIKRDATGNNNKSLWFKYIFKGSKDAIKIVI